jgi:Transcription factor WhiB
VIAMRADQLSGGVESAPLAELLGHGFGVVEPWTDRAACRETVTSSEADLFFSPDSDDRRESFTEIVAREVAALAVCEQCPVRAECLAFAVATRQEHGVWGGRTETQVRRLVAQAGLAERRRPIATGRQRGRPPVTQCPAGHPYDEVNTYVTQAGKRHCQTCRRARALVQQQRLASRRTHCPAGHPYDEANTHVTGHGRRTCRTCAAARARAEWRRIAGQHARGTRGRSS